MRDLILEALAKYPNGLRQRMIADGREHIKRFTDETLCADLMRVYEKTMSQPSATR